MAIVVQAKSMHTKTGPPNPSYAKKNRVKMVSKQVFAGEPPLIDFHSRGPLW